MNRAHYLSVAAGLGLFALALGTSPTRADSVFPTKHWSGELEDIALEKQAPARGFITSLNKDDFAKLWKAWMGKDKLPEIDFDKEVVVVTTSRQTAIRGVVLDLQKGDATVLLVVKAKDREVKGFAFAISVLKREGIIAIDGIPVSPF